MKLNKFIVMPLSISLFSTLVLGSVSTQQVKADTGNSDTSIIKSDQIQSNTNNTSNPEKNATAQQEPQPEVKPPTSSDSSQKVTLSFVDNEGNPIVNSVGTPYTISENKNTGDTITSSDLANQIKTDLNDSYTITDSNNNIIVQKDNDKYTIELTPKSYKFAIARNPNDGDSYALNATLTVGKAITAQYGDNGSDSSSAKNVADQTFDGYGFSYLVYGSNGDTIPNTSNGKLKITYDMIPEFTKKYSNSINGYLITAFYKQPLNQTLTLKHVDDLGNEIPNTTDETVTGYKTGNIIVDPYSLATVKNIPGYTYLKVTRPYTVSNNNSINLIYKKNDINYLKVNYTDQNTNKVIYTDYLRGNVGDKVTVKDISSIEGYNNFKMSNQQVAGNYIIKQDNEILNVNISEKDPFIIVLKQNDGNIILTTKLITKFGNPIDTNQLNYLSDNLADVDSFNINYENNLQSLTKSQLEDLTTTQNITTPSQLVGTLINSADAVVSDGENGLSGKNMEMTLNYNINNPYKNIHITYQNEDGTIIEQKDLTDNSTSIEASDLVKSNLPNDYALINQDIPYLIHDITNNNVNLISIVKKTINSNDNDHSDNNSTSTSPDVISIESTIGTHPAALTKINIYDNNGYLTDKTVAPNSNWYTDREMLIKGTKYYRIATDQWLKIDDVYIYQNNPVYLSTYSDTAKHLVNSQNLKVNREVAANSDWYSDRYAYFDNQKYYRLATNEWVNANDVYEYKPVDQTVQPNSSAILFDDRYNPVRTIVNSIALKTDKTANIKGSNMYHVATNEWLPVSETK